ncbi:phage tail assembly protein T [Telluria sp. B2]
MSVRQAQMQISSAEFTEWQAFYQLEPFGDLVADMRHGVATSLHANLNRDPKVRPEPYRPDDFIHWRESNVPVETEPELLDDPVAQSNLIRAKIFGMPPQ